MLEYVAMKPLVLFFTWSTVKNIWPRRAGPNSLPALCQLTVHFFKSFEDLLVWSMNKFQLDGIGLVGGVKKTRVNLRAKLMAHDT